MLRSVQARNYGSDREDKHMLLGGTIAGQYRNPEEWEQLLKASHFKAVTAPFNCRTTQAEIDAYCAAAARQGAVIAEVGVWKNVFDPDPARAAEAMEYAIGQLALADACGISCCVNIAGTRSTAGWDAADPDNYSQEMYDKTVESIQKIIDSARPSWAYYCIEPMPWMVPDSPEAYLQLIRDVDREQFGAHMDFVNMINCPRRYLNAESFIDECFRMLAPYIRSTHLKDSRMHPTRLTAILEECSPGEGQLNFANVLAIMDKYLSADAPVLLEHMQTFDEYKKAYDYVSAQAAKAGIPV